MKFEDDLGIKWKGNCRRTFRTPEGVYGMLFVRTSDRFVFHDVKMFAAKIDVFLGSEKVGHRLSIESIPVWLALPGGPKPPPDLFVNAFWIDVKRKALYGLVYDLLNSVMPQPAQPPA